MTTEQHTVQDQPAEGDRDMIERELKRQDGKETDDNRKDMERQEAGSASNTKAD